MSLPHRPSDNRSAPHRIYSNWLEDAQAQSLFSYAVASEAQFTPGTLSDRPYLSHVDTSGRRLLILRDLGPFAALLSARARAVQHDLETAFGMPHIPATDVELEMVAHRDGDFFLPHIDTFTRTVDSLPTNRRLSLVYYFHRLPSRFTGGRLSLHAPGSGQPVALQPLHNSLMAFPSFLPHEVQPVSCPDGAFADSRFSVNIWLWGRTGGSPS